MKKRILGITLIVALLACLLTGCAKDRVLYSETNLSKYVQLSKYIGIEVNTTTETFKEYTDDIIESDVVNNDLYAYGKTGTVKEGDTVNIDYVGRKNGIAFEGGTANGAELEIGSGKFIAGFEEGLIGKEIGSTVDLNLTFPKDYGNEALNGQAVVFTVKINYVDSKEPRQPQDFYADLEFDSYEAYMADVKERAVKTYLVNYITSNSLVLDYPKKDKDYLIDTILEVENYNVYMSQQIDLETYVTSQLGKTMSEYKSNLITSEIQPMMNTQMVYYAILDAEKMEIDKEKVEEKIKETIDSFEGKYTRDQIIKGYGEYYFEALTVSEQIYDLVRENAVIKD